MNFSPLTFFRILGLATLCELVVLSTVTAADEVMFDAKEGFSDLQGAGGWSYAGVSYADVDDLAGKEIQARYVESEAEWQAGAPDGRFVRINASQQNKLDGNALFSLRYWTADRDYANVRVESTLIPTTALGAYIAMVDGKTLTTKRLTESTWVLNTTILRRGEGDPIPINVNLVDVKAGDRIYFVMQNGDGEGPGGDVMQTWEQIIYATPTK